MSEIRGEHGPELVNLPPGRHLRPVAPVFRESAPPPSRLRRFWSGVVDFAFMAAAVVAVFWDDRRRARRWP